MQIVLVHGAWGGSYGFRQVRPILAASGHDVFTPSLTGIGERSHLTNPGITLDTHISDVVNTVLYEDLDDVLLLGFSYGGLVVTGALEHIGDRVRHLVYMDALVPGDGDSAESLTGLGPTPSSGLQQAWLIPPLPRDLGDPEATAWSEARRSHQPVGTFTTPVRLSHPLEEWSFSLSFIKATADPTEHAESAFWQAARRAQASDDWAYHEIETHHLIPMTHPEELAKILSELASSVP